VPIVFVVEDNGWGISTPTSDTKPIALGVLNAQRVIQVDGRDPETLSSVAAAIDLPRIGPGPSIVWVSFDRLGSHSASDDQRITGHRPNWKAWPGAII
jgi:TPP-dependent pyruvate/acetoin dehydrogenase alpha subunit